MSAREDNKHTRAWARAEKMLAEEEGDIDGVEELSDEELEKEMHLNGYDVAGVPSADEFLARGMARRSALAPARSRRMRWVVTLAAALFALLVALAATRGPENADLFKHDSGHIGPDNEWQPPKKPLPTPEERAEGLRDDAIGACGAAQWTLCQQKLDAAQTLDPAGENEERVKKARRAIGTGLHPWSDDKPRK